MRVRPRKPENPKTRNCGKSATPGDLSGVRAAACRVGYLAVRPLCMKPLESGAHDVGDDVETLRVKNEFDSGFRESGIRG